MGLGYLLAVIAVCASLIAALDLAASRWGERVYSFLAALAEPLGTGRGRMADWDEALYLAAYPNVADDVRAGRIESGLRHYIVHGHYNGYHRNPITSAVQALPIVFPGPPLVVREAITVERLARDLGLPEGDIRVVNGNLPGTVPPGAELRVPVRVK